MEVSLLVFQCCGTYHTPNNPGSEFFPGETEVFPAANPYFGGLPDKCLQSRMQLSSSMSISATCLTFVETCKLMAKAPLDFFRGFFDMVVAGRQDYPDMTKALLC